MSQTCIVILGMHRSGTSALTGVLSLLGIHAGDTLLPAVEEVNPKGFWEHAEIVSIHEQLLNALNSSWEDENALPDQWWLSPSVDDFRSRIVSALRRDFGNLPVWLIKDPRMCRLLPLWQQVLHELGCQPLYVLAVRNPAEVAHSLRKRDNLTEESSCLLWLTHMLEAEFRTRGKQRVFATYERLLSDWQGTIGDIGKTLRFDWPVAPADAAPNIDAFLDPALRHHADTETLSDHPACRLAQEGFELLTAPNPDVIKLDHLRARTEDLVSLVAPWLKQLRRNERLIRQDRATILQDRATILQDSAIIARNEMENAALHAEIQRIKNSPSWQITKPLRLLTHLVRTPKAVFTELRGRLPIAFRANDYSVAVPFGYPPKEWKSFPRLAVICHVFYVDLLDEFVGYFSNIPFQFDLYITTDTEEKRDQIEKSFSHWKGKIEVRIAPNRGRDIAPMLITCRDVYNHYEYILHVHTKKSPHQGRLSGWRNYILETLLGSTEVVNSIFEAFRSSPNLGMIAPQHFAAIHKAVGWGENFEIAQLLAQKIGIRISRNELIDFPSGSMFWARAAAIKPLLDCDFAFDDFPRETGQLDETLGHAIERFFFFSCERAGYSWIKISRPNLTGNFGVEKIIATHDDLVDFINNPKRKLIRPK